MFAKFKNHGAKVLLAGCALMALSSAAWADQTHVSYNLAAGASLAVNVPATNTPVSLTCVQNTSGTRGVGQATLLRVSPSSFLEWIGFDIANNGVVSTGFSSAAGTHIIYCDFSKNVDIQVNNDTQILIKNTGGGAVTGVLNFVW